MTNSNNTENVEIQVAFPLTQLLTFAIKVLIVVVALVIGARMMTPELPEIKDTPTNRLLLIGWINNPYVLTQMSVIQEESGNFEKSLMLAEAALGLQKMHNPNEQTYKEYADRIKALKIKMNEAKAK